MSIWILILAVAPLYVWAALHVRKSKTTWSRFEVIELHLLRLTKEVWLLDKKCGSKTTKHNSKKRTRKKRS